MDGSTAERAYDPERKIGLVLLTNVGDAPLAPLGDEFLRRLAASSR
ncbi:MAG: hypothetical protein ACE5KX_07005 [Acidimicrobiia bacterium]